MAVTKPPALVLSLKARACRGNCRTRMGDASLDFRTYIGLLRSSTRSSLGRIHVPTFHRSHVVGRNEATACAPVDSPSLPGGSRSAAIAAD